MAQDISPAAVRNCLLRNLSDQAFQVLASTLEPIELPQGMVLEAPYAPIDHVIFFESGVAARMVVGHNESMAVSGHIGFEGMTGKPIVQGIPFATNLIRMQLDGTGWRIASEPFIEAMSRCEGIAVLMRKYVLASEVQLEHSLLAATANTISTRLARLLLMYHDRAEGDLLPLTHDLLAQMLRVRRAGTTSATHILEGNRAIRATRGRIEIIDRQALEGCSDGSYGMPEAIYDRLILSGSYDERITLNRKLEALIYCDF